MSDPHGLWVPPFAKTAKDGAASLGVAQRKSKSSDKSVRPTRSVLCMKLKLKVPSTGSGQALDSAIDFPEGNQLLRSG